MDDRRSAPATARNRDPILAVLRRVLPPEGLVLEVACGTGEHAAYFAPRLPGRVWQPTDPSPEARASADAWAASLAAPNLRPALPLDASAADWPLRAADAVFCCNMIHISPWASALGLVAGAGRLLPVGGPLILYGPFRVGGEMVESNVRFDAWLRGQDPAWGVRDLEAVEAAALAAGLALEEVVPMPANNLTVILRRR